MALPITSAHDCIILDACCVMNLYASKQMESIVSAIAETVAVSLYVMQVEALFVYSESKKSNPADRESIRLEPLIENGLITIANLETAAEKNAFVNFTSQRLDDGEAATMAIAVNRNWAVATDDRAAIRVLSDQQHSLEVVSTPELIKHWQETRSIKQERLRRAILNIENRANYLVGRRHTLFAWWHSCKSG